MSPILWQPESERAQSSQIMAMANANGFTGADAIAGLRRWSITDPAEFWQQVWELGGVKCSQAAQSILVNGDRMPGASWFAGAKLNFAENLLKRDDDAPAIIAYKESGERREINWQELHAQTRALAAAMADDGVGVGDRVAGYLPNCPEAIIGMLAATSLGAIWSSASPDFGTSGVLDRFGQIEPKALITVDGYLYNGKSLDIREKVATVAGQLPSLRRTVIVPFLNADADPGPVQGASMLGDYQKTNAQELSFAQLPFDHPLYILYSSGTTGKPKAIVHGAGGNAAAAH